MEVTFATRLRWFSADATGPFLSPLQQLEQEGQLSLRDRAMLRVIEYFAQSLKVIRNDTLEKGVSPY